MPSAVPLDDDDPVVASYDVFVTNTDVSTEVKSRLYVLQYPSHRPFSKPYNAAWSQKPTTLRLKPETGMIEVEIPVLTQEYYNIHAGEKFGQSLAEGQVGKKGGSYGLAGGFSYAPASNVGLHDVRAHDEEASVLQSQSLGGKIARPSQRDPVYMLGVLHNDGLHLTHLDGVVQMRPQLHHIDAEDEIEKRKLQASSSGRTKQGFEPGPPKLETKAIELKMKNNNEDAKTRSVDENPRLLRAIQAEQWSRHDWVDEEDQAAWTKYQERLMLRPEEEIKVLRSVIGNDDWLDKMSAPREDGKKGLRSKLKGRDRERARRKKVESQRRQQASNVVPGAQEVTSDSDLSSLGEQSDGEVADPGADMVEVDIKQEPGTATAPAVIPGVADAVPIAPAPAKKRGRPKKTAEVVSVDD